VTFRLLMVLLLYGAAARLLLPPTLRFLLRHGIVAPNYKGRSIPARMGLYLWLTAAGFGLILVMLQGGTGGIPERQPLPSYTRYVLALTLVCFAGWLDDSLGTPGIRGIRGHWRAFRQGELSTGAFKALAVFAAAAWIVWPGAASLPVKILQVLLIGFSTNALNLLDLRPGRALKGFFLGIAALFALFPAAGPGLSLAACFYMYPVILGSLYLFPGDLKARWMLGDTGSNLLGFCLGCWVVLFFPFWFQSLGLAAAVFLHWIAETSSLTRIIDRHSLLRRLDGWGRTEESPQAAGEPFDGSRT